MILRHERWINLLLDKQTGLPLFHQDKETGIYIFQSKIDLLAKFADKVVKSLFDEEVTHREQTTGEGYKLDRVRQGYFIVRNSYK